MSPRSPSVSEARLLNWLTERLADERRSPLAYLAESGRWTGHPREDVPELLAELRDIGAADLTHAQQLAEALARRGAVPRFPSLGDFSHLHFARARFLLPQCRAAKSALLAGYDSAPPELSDRPEWAELIAAIRSNEVAHVERLAHWVNVLGAAPAAPDEQEP